MKIGLIDNKTNFCWRDKSHRDITAKAIADLPELAMYKDVLIEFVQNPDFDERGFKGNNHFYYTPISGNPSTSFLDINGRNNAASKFSEHMTKFKELLPKNKNKALEHAGRALHFLQDVTQPQHTERGTVFRKWKDLKMHEAFETYTLQRQDEFIKNSESINVDSPSNNPNDLFFSAVSKSQQGKHVKKDNLNEWNEIAQDGILNAIQVTNSFLKYISTQL